MLYSLCSFMRLPQADGAPERVEVDDEAFVELVELMNPTRRRPCRRSRLGIRDDIDVRRNKTQHPTTASAVWTHPWRLLGSDSDCVLSTCPIRLP